MNQALTLQPIAGTRERLLHTALECFSTHGYQSTSLRDLASLVGVQPGSSTTISRTNRACCSS
ncbi:TetR/AcrR family transcriptional regulator [Pseudomonas sp. TH10]|uniref:TetR/AcrR family transcriptional regulator n=1 Tax=Pseudomonas sp. TH10 TaxID=2796376 RepID=UPI001911A3D4|nr:TetR/AcrR family transcriptional regulator [Pseudomonas sp. TH10]